MTIFKISGAHDGPFVKMIIRGMMMMMMMSECKVLLIVFTKQT
jgi:hypothetical protein